MSNYYALYEMAKAQQQDMRKAANARRLSRLALAQRPRRLAGMAANMAAYLKRSRLGSASVAQADEVKPRPLGSEPAQSI